MGNEKIVGNNLKLEAKARKEEEEERVSEISPTLLLFVDRRVLLGVLILAEGLFLSLLPKSLLSLFFFEFFEEQGKKKVPISRVFLFLFFSLGDFERMIRLWILALQMSELFVSSVVHLVYGFYIFSTAVAFDLSQALNDCFKPNVNIGVEEDESRGGSPSVDGLPPIVLVHGIFGFGKGVRCYFPFL